MMRAMLTPPAALEALLFSSGEPLEKNQLKTILNLTDAEFALVIKAFSSLLRGEVSRLLRPKMSWNYALHLKRRRW